MKVFTKTAAPVAEADPRTFVGRARIQKAAEDAEGVPVVVYRVEFADGGRTNWHIHSGTQWLFVTEGRIRVQTWGEEPREVDVGDTVLIAAGEKHWHGAAPGSSGTHIAVNLDFTTEWMEPVTDDDYRSRRSRR